MAKHPFILNDENVNEYGYRIITAGIDYSQFLKNPVVLFMHTRGADPKTVIGRVSNIRVDGVKLLGDIEFDSEDEYAKAIEGKVERGFLRMCSLRGPILETSSDAKLILKGQTKETVTKMKLKEVSIVDIGGNDNAVKLSDANGNEIQLADITLKNKSQQKDENIMKELELFVAQLAATLGLDSKSTADEVQSAIKDLKSGNVELASKIEAIELADKNAKEAEAKELSKKMVELGLVPSHLESMQVKLFAEDFDGAKANAVKLIADAEKDSNEDGKEVSLSGDVKTFLDNVKGKAKGKAVAKLGDFSEEQLIEMQEKEPARFAKLVDDYEGTELKR